MNRAPTLLVVVLKYEASLLHNGAHQLVGYVNTTSLCYCEVPKKAPIVTRTHDPMSCDHTTNGAFFKHILNLVRSHV